MKIITIVGARPQFVKAAVVSRAFRHYAPDVTEIILHTGQHYDSDMSRIFFEELDIPDPNYNLAIGGGTHGQNTGRMIEQIEPILLEEKPDWVLVYGDTDSTLSGALAAAKLHIPVAHVEAGLRSFNRKMPEELNRVLTDHLSDLLLTPTEIATANLSKEGITGDNVRQIGDVMYDATLYYKDKAKKPEGIPAETNFVLCTIHRAENTDDSQRLSSIIKAINEIAKETAVVLPLHPRTRQLLSEGSYDTNNMTLINPVGYLEMIWLLTNCRLVITDSGGLQKEASFFNKPCLTTRDETEWVELVESGMNTLVGADNKKIIESALPYLNKKVRLPDHSFYGTGNAGLGVVTSLIGSE